jgi:hypothetical protein
MLGEKLGIPLKLIISPSVKVSPILKFRIMQAHNVTGVRNVNYFFFSAKNALGLENFKFFF